MIELWARTADVELAYHRERIVDGLQAARARRGRHRPPRRRAGDRTRTGDTRVAA
ncbi:hypothetical protein [Cellulomonas sp. HZM]|uniref:hypothetical protein n=1 Tax=Cellulomonas sp. HZM TaxID=1454010 RepID=UPI000A7D7FE2|nr:hypothetical protein [Cellulomonas sp. HZM]